MPASFLFQISSLVFAYPHILFGELFVPFIFLLLLKLEQLKQLFAQLSPSFFTSLIAHPLVSSFWGLFFLLGDSFLGDASFLCDFFGDTFLGGPTLVRGWLAFQMVHWLA
jgi:hypothetical protein